MDDYTFVSLSSLSSKKGKMSRKKQGALLKAGNFFPPPGHVAIINDGNQNELKMICTGGYRKGMPTKFDSCLIETTFGVSENNLEVKAVTSNSMTGSALPPLHHATMLNLGERCFIIWGGLNTDILSTSDAAFKMVQKTPSRGAVRIPPYDITMYTATLFKPTLAKKALPTQSGNIPSELFVSNVFAQVEKQELKVSQNQTVSHILEKLLSMSNGKHLCGFLQGLHEAGDVCNAAKDRFAAHVLQTAILTALPFVEDPDCSSDLQPILLAVCKEVINKVAEFIYHTYAAHVLSAVVEVLAGVKVPEQVTRSRLSQGQMHAKDHGRDPKVIVKEVPDTFLNELRRTTQMILHVDSIVDLLLNQVASPVVAVLLLVLKSADTDLHRDLCKVIIKSCKLQTKQLNESTPPAMLTHQIASHVIEILIQTSPEDQFNKLCSSCFRGRYKQVALHSTANFVLQRVITRAIHTEMFEELFSELSNCIEDMLAVNHLGVVIRLAEACVQRPQQQGALIVALLKAFHCDTPKERQSTCVVLIASLTTHDVYFGDEAKEQDGDRKETEVSKVNSRSQKTLTMNFHGSLLLQQLLKFKNCASISAGFMALTPDDLVAMACDPAGSFLLEAFMASGVNEKKKDKVIDKFKGHCLKVACNRNGSRTIDSIFAAASMKSKFTIAEELAAKDDQLAGDQYGRHVHRNCALNHFKYRLNQWRELQGRETKKRKLFAEIIGGEEDEESAKKKKKKKKDKLSSDVYQKEMMVLGVGMATEEEDLDKDQTEEARTKDEDDIQDIFSKMTSHHQQPSTATASPTSSSRSSKHKRTSNTEEHNKDGEQSSSSHGKHKKKKKKHKHGSQ